ncbi:Protein CHROMATIN REMODELING 24 [Forsythia ovata]|uniref:Protein CHROMATIN REMODELING 24 n=1 Tax=Forsythia ovata TaxID=205694 RepID=A0ABD1T7E4_9LAMI
MGPILPKNFVPNGRTIFVETFDVGTKYLAPSLTQYLTWETFLGDISEASNFSLPSSHCPNFKFNHHFHCPEPAVQHLVVSVEQVAWYPIYRIPDSTLRAAFLTYHSLGHLVRRNPIYDSSVDTCIVSPVVGLQSYIAQESLMSSDYKFLRIDGTTKASDRAEIVKDFQEGRGAPIFLLTSQVGGLGLTLTKEDRVIVVDPAWNPSSRHAMVIRRCPFSQAFYAFYKTFMQ